MPDAQTAVLVKAIIDSGRQTRRHINLVIIILTILCTIMAVRFWYNDRSRDSLTQCNIKEAAHGNPKRNR